jgi:hypothetical protein
VVTTIVTRGASMLRECDEVKITSQGSPKMDPSRMTEGKATSALAARDTNR